MPFQDIEDTAATEVSHAPSTLKRGLLKLFVEDWGLKLLALAITLVLWLAVAGVNKPVTIRRTVQLNFIRSDDSEISNDPPKSVDILLTGSRTKLERISPLDLMATVDVSNNKAGEKALRLSTDLVQIDLPEGVKIESFQPDTIPIRLEARVERQLEIEVRLEGKTADGYELYAARPMQKTVTVRGPATHLDALGKAPTETISIEGRKESFTASRVAFDISDHKVDALNAAVDVAIEIGERRIEKGFTGIPVESTTGAIVEPRSANVVLLVPASLLGQLRREDLKLVVDTSATSTATPRLVLSPAIQEKVKLSSTKPSQFYVKK